MGLFRNKYQIESNRLNCWDYSSPGYYFVTICVKNMQCDFGQVIDQKMHYSENGQIIAEEWIRTAIIRSNIALDQWVVMPNHIHGIILIKNDRYNVETTRRVVSTCLFPNSLGSIIGQFKSICTKRVWTAGYHDFHWQRNYHDHIIRNYKDFIRIRVYIANNPQNWNKDEYNK